MMRGIAHAFETAANKVDDWITHVIGRSDDELRRVLDEFGGDSGVEEVVLDLVSPGVADA